MFKAAILLTALCLTLSVAQKITVNLEIPAENKDFSVSVEEGSSLKTAMLQGQTNKAWTFSGKTGPGGNYIITKIDNIGVKYPVFWQASVDGNAVLDVDNYVVTDGMKVLFNRVIQQDQVIDCGQTTFGCINGSDEILPSVWLLISTTLAIFTIWGY